jgi:hypothetical protein
VEERCSTNPKPDPVSARTDRIWKDAQRTMSTNLAEGIALSHALLRFTGAARRSE